MPLAARADQTWDKFVQDVTAGWDNSFKIRWDQLLRRPYDSELHNLLDRWTVAPNFTLPLDQSRQPGAAGNGSRISSSLTTQLNLRYEPVESWFAALTMYKYLDESRRQPWNPDFTYAFGFDDYRPYTFGLVYSNYANNRFNAPSSVQPTGFLFGTISASYKLPLPGILANKLLIDRERTVMCRISYNLTPRYYDRAGLRRDNKQYAALGCRYPIWGKFYMDGQIYRYVGGKQQPWDPDYTYGFGFFDIQSGTVSIQYSNYSGTRFPWRTGSPGTGRFIDGQIGITWNAPF